MMRFYFLIVVAVLSLFPMVLAQSAGSSDACSIRFDSGLSNAQRSDLLFIADQTLGAASTQTNETFGIPNANGLFVILWQNGRRVGVGFSSNPDLGSAVQEATTHAVSSLKKEQLIDSKSRIQIDVLGPKKRSFDFESEFERGIHSVWVHSFKDKTFLLSGTPITHNYSVSRTQDHLCAKINQSTGCFSQPSVLVGLFETDSFIEDSTGGVVLLSRQMPFFSLEQLSQSEIRKRSNWIGDWFVNNQNERGDFAYLYYAYSANISKQYNSVREIASVWSLAELVQKTKSLRYQASAKRALDFFLKTKTKENSELGTRFLVESDGFESLLGSNAFLLLSLVTLNDPEFESFEEPVLKHLFSQQHENGEFDTALINKVSTSRVNYFPGEALTALGAYYEKRRDPRALDALKKGFSFYSSYWRQNKNAAFIPWHTRANYHLFKETNDPTVRDFVFEMNDWLLNFQVTNPSRCEQDGGFWKSTQKNYTPAALAGLSSNSTSVYTESLAHAFAVAKQSNDLARMQSYRLAALRALRFAFQLQLTPENDYFVHLPKAQGGLRTTLASTEVRVDNQQHALMATLAALSFFESSDFE